MKKPFYIISGEGLGLINTTQSIINNNPVSGEAFGQAPIQSYANIASGNLIVQTPVLKLDDPLFVIQFYWTYNSQGQDKAKWHFNWDKKLLQPNPQSNTLQLVESDGHITTYQKDPNRGNVYFSQNIGEGTPYFSFDSVKNRFRKYDPKAQCYEYYDQSGRLISTENLTGLAMNLNYDNQGRLQNIVAASGVIYNMNWQSDGLIINMQEGSESIDLHYYGFDSQQRLIHETYPKSNYSLTYNYNNQNQQLRKVIQTDNTEIDFSYDADVDTGKVNVMQFGIDNRNTIDYSDRANIIVADNMKNEMQFGLNTNGLINTIKLPTGYDGVYKQDNFDVTTYAYQANTFCANNMTLASVTNPNGGIIQYQYDNVCNLKIVEIGPNNQLQTWFYQQGGDIPLLLSVAEYLDPKKPETSLITRFVYDTNFNNTGNIALRYRISPSGSVQELRYNLQTKLLDSHRHYLADAFNLSHYTNPKANPAYNDLLQFTAKANQSAINLTEYEYSLRGQIILSKTYTKVNDKGVGEENETMSKNRYGWDDYGNKVLHIEQQDANTTATWRHSFDDLQRERLRIDPLMRKWKWQYVDVNQQVIQTLPDGKQEIKAWDKQGNISSHLVSAMVETQEQFRKTEYRRDHNGLPVLTIPPTLLAEEANLPRLQQFFDRQYRPGFTISRIGRVKETRIDTQKRLIRKIAYNKTIDIKKLYIKWPPLVSELPSVARLVKQLPTELGEFDQENIILLSLNGKPRFQVDAEGFITEIRYDNLDRVIAHIIYDQKITANEKKALLQGNELTRTPNNEIDAISRIFYADEKDKILATQDANGYITENFYDAGNRKIQTLTYYVNLPVDLNIPDFKRPPLTPGRDAYTHHWFDDKDNEIATVNPNNYLTIKAYYANNKLQSSHRYEQKVKVIARQIPVGVPLPNDEIHYFTYDLAKREIQVDASTGLTEVKKYDINDNITLDQLYDRRYPKLSTPNYQKNTQAKFDAWSQKTKSANVFVGQLMTDIETDTQLSQEQKKVEINKIWQEQATHDHFDATGLHLYSKNGLGGYTYYYYDDDLRPIYTINPTGCITQIIYDAFNNPIATYEYGAFFPDDKRDGLTGGIITDIVRNYLDSLKNSGKEKDRVTGRNFNNRNQVSKVTDPEGFISAFRYNATRKCILEQFGLDVNSGKSTQTINHEFNLRGLETATIKSDGKNKTIERHEYNHFTGNETIYINPIGGKTTKELDPLGQVVTQINPLEVIDFEKKYGFDGRTIEEKDANGNVTTHDYDQITLSHTIQYPIVGVKKTETQDVFKSTIKIEDADGSKQTFTHAPNGNVHERIDQLKNTTTTDYNVMGLVTDIKHPNQSIDHKEYNLAGKLTGTCRDQLGQAQKIEYTLNAFGENAEIKNPNGTVTINLHNGNGLNTETCIDPEGLQLITTRKFNAFKTKISESQGNKQNPDQYKEEYLKDGLNRDIGKIIAPETLNITTENKLNAAGQIVVTIDANSNATYHFYNDNKQKRFSVNPEGGVSEWTYDGVGENLVHLERELTKGLDPTINDLSKMTLAELDKKVIRSADDKQRWTFRDTNKRERFQVNGRGQVIETVYDNVNNPIQIINYGTAIDALLLPDLTTADLATWTKDKKDNPKNRISYHAFDAAKNERFVINAEQYITEKRYLNNKVIAEIKYATKITNPTQLINFPVDEIAAKIPKDIDNDREVWEIQDSVGNPWFKIIKIAKDAAAVIRFLHDKNNNLLETCEFADPIVWPVQDYATLKIICAALISVPEKDKINQTKFDKADRKYKKTNPLNYSQEFELDAVGNQKKIIDEIESEFGFAFDAAKRQTDEILPTTNVTFIATKANDGHSALEPHVLKNYNIIHHKDYDDEGNIVKITRAKGSNDERTMDLYYNKCNKQRLIVVPNVRIDDPTKPASFNDRPEQIVKLSKWTIYDFRQRKIAESGYDDRWTLYIYDNEDNEVFCIKPNKTIVGRTYDIFNEEETITEYDCQLTIELESYIKQIIDSKTQLALNVLCARNGFIPSAADRTTSFAYNKEGKIITTTHPQAPYFLPSATTDGQYCYTSPIEKFDYNAFGEAICSAEIVDPQANIYRRKITWRDTRGKELATCGYKNEIDRYFLNTFGDRTGLLEWALPPTINPDITTTLSDLDKACKQDENDVLTVFKYNLCAKEISKTTHNQVISVLSLSEKTNIPEAHNLLPQDLTQKYGYDPRGLKISIIHEDASVEYLFYDANKIQIAATEVTRTSLSGKILTPLTYYGVNAHGERVLTRKFASGTKKILQPTAKPPVPINFDDRFDQQTLTLFDNRGLEIAKQTEEGAVSFKTRTKARKVAREYHAILEPKMDDSVIYHMDEHRLCYDAVNNPLMVCYYRDNLILQERTSISVHNSFNEEIAKGTLDKNNEPRFFQFNNYASNGQCWQSNEDKGVWEIKLTNLQHKQTITVISQSDVDLSQIKLDTSLANLFDSSLYPYTNILRTESIYDNADNIVTLMAPAYDQQEGPDDLPLSMYIGKKYQTDFGQVNMTWCVPQETNVNYPTITLQLQNSNNATPNDNQLPIVIKGNRCGVDLSSLPTGIYHYEIDYALNVGNQNVIYATEGAIQFIGTTDTNSIHVVPVVEKNNQLKLSGATSGISAVDVWGDDGDLVAKIPVNITQQGFYADLSSLKTGTYTITPVGTVNNYASLPFTIYTPTPSDEPFAQEIDLDLQILWLYSHLQVNWQMDSIYANKSIELTCVYIGIDNEVHIDSAVLTPGKFIKDYPDKNQKILHCNMELSTAVREISHVNLSIIADDSQTLIPLLQNYKPEPRKDKPNFEEASDTIQGAIFTPTCFAFISPIQNPQQYNTFLYFATNKDRQADWEKLAIAAFVTPKQDAKTKPGIIIDVSKFSFGIYPWKFGVGNNKRAILASKIAHVSGSFSIAGMNGVVFASDPHHKKPVMQRPKQIYQQDRWHNQTYHQDSLDNVTQQKFKRNKVTEIIEPAVPVTDAQLVTTMQSPVTHCYYGKHNELIAVKDANGHIEGYVRDTALHTVKHALPEGTFETQNEYDALNNLVEQYDDVGQLWKFLNNRRSKLLKLTSPTGRQFIYEYDELDHRYKEFFPSKKSIYRYAFDSFGNIKIKYLPKGQSTYFDTDRNNLPTLQTNADNTKLITERDFWGNPDRFQDLEGASTYFKRDRAGKVINKYRVGGSTAQELVYDGETGSNQGKAYFNTHVETLENMNLAFTWRNNLLASVNDLALNQTSNYTLDTEGRKISHAIIGPGGTLLNQITSQLDARGAPTLTIDNIVTTQGFNDAVGNRRRLTMTGVVIAHLGPYQQPVAINMDSGFTYDNADRTLIFNGTVDEFTFQISIDQGQGYLFSWKGNQRQTETHYQWVQKSLYDPGELAYYFKNLTWDPDYRLSKIVETSTCSGQAVTSQNASLTWGPDDYVDDYQNDYFENATLQSANFWWPGQHKTIHDQPVYDENGWPVSDVQTSYADDEATVTSTTIFTTDQNTGEVTHQNTNYSSSDPNYCGTDNFDNIYVSRATRQLQIIRGQRSNSHGTSDIESTHVYYTPNEQPQGIMRGGDLTGCNLNIITYDNTLLSSFFLQNYYDLIEAGMYYNSGETLTRYVNDTEGNMLANYFLGSNAFTWTDLHVGILPNYMVQKNFPPRGPSRYDIQIGDSLQSITQRFTGDSALTDKFSILSGYGPGQFYSAVPGTTLIAPNILPMHNRFNTYEPFNILVNIFMEQVFLALKTPQPKPKHRSSSWWHTLLEAVVEVVIIIVVPELAGMSGILIDAVAGAIASAAGQGVAIALHDQTKFSIQSMLESAAIAAAIPANEKMMGVDQAARQSLYQQIGREAMSYGLSNLQMQFALMSLGLKNHIDFNEVARYGINGAINAIAKNNFGKATQQKQTVTSRTNGFANTFIREQVTTVAEGVIDAAIAKERINIADLEAEAIGTTIGTKLGDEINESINKYRESVLHAHGISRNNQFTTNNKNSQQNRYNPNNANASVNDDQMPSYGQAERANNTKYQNKINQFGIFGGSKQTANQKQMSDDEFKAMLEEKEFRQAEYSFGDVHAQITNQTVLTKFDAGDGIAHYRDNATGNLFVQTKQGLHLVVSNDTREGIDSLHPELWLAGARDAYVLAAAVIKNPGLLLSASRIISGLFKEEAPATTVQAARISPNKVKADAVNKLFEEAGQNAPYATSMGPRTITLNQDRIFVRVYGRDNQVGSWLMRADEIEGLTPAQIQNKFALPELPRYVSEVHVPSGTNLRIGRAAAQVGWGKGGGIQYELLDRLPEAAFNKAPPMPLLQKYMEIKLMEDEYVWSHLIRR